MRFILDTNILIPLEDSQLPLEASLANFKRLANENGHQLIYHPASEEDIQQDEDADRRKKTLQRLRQYTRLDVRPICPWNTPEINRNDGADNEILYAISLNAAHALVTEDRGIHSKAKTRGLAQRVYTIQTAEDQLRRLHEQTSVQLPNIEDVPLYSLTPHLSSQFFESLREGYPDFNTWFENKAQEGRRAWVSWEHDGTPGGICIYAQQHNERITEEITLPGAALKIATFKVGETSRGKKVGELFLKAVFRYAISNRLENIFIHGDTDRHHFLFEMLLDFGFVQVGFHPGSNGRDAVYLKKHPEIPPHDSLPPFEYARRYFPHFRHDEAVTKFIIPIKPEYHRILFPDYNSPADRQMSLFRPQNTAGNAIKMAYLCHAKTKTINPGDLMLFYRSGDERAITSIGVVESYETLADASDIATKVKRRTVYTMADIDLMTQKPTRVMLFRLVRHLAVPLPQKWLEQQEILRGPPQSITRIVNENFERILLEGR
jgi:histone H3/H4